MKTLIIWIVVILIVVFGGWYWWSSQQNAAAPMIPVTSTTTGTPQQPADVALSGGHAVAANGMTVYTYDNDTAGTSTCADACAQTWPPYLVSTSSLNLGAGLSGTLGTITRADGTMQATYNGMPLYFYSKDVNVGDTNGDGIGGVWHIVTQ